MCPCICVTYSRVRHTKECDCGTMSASHRGVPNGYASTQGGRGRGGGLVEEDAAAAVLLMSFIFGDEPKQASQELFLGAREGTPYIIFT